MQLFSNMFLPVRFYIVFSVAIALFLMGFIVPILMYVGWGVLNFGGLAVLADGIWLFKRSVLFKAQRVLPKVLSLGDECKVELVVKNTSKSNFKLKVIDELPYQLQIRDLLLKTKISKNQLLKLSYVITPKERGAFHFGHLQIFASTQLGLVEKRQTIPIPKELPVYPSIIQMKKYELSAFASSVRDIGVKKLRKTGHSYEFEQIKNYVIGDDPRSINWKASSRFNSLMVNQYEDERSQSVYAIIDKSRAMKMPFNGLSLLDYSINTALTISNIALKKYDKAGLLTFSDKIGSIIKADNKKLQLKRILNALYNEKERNLESKYDLLYTALGKVIPHRSLLFLYTNFESYYALERVLPTLRKIAKKHLLVVMFFENSELSEYALKVPETTIDIYNQTIAKRIGNVKLKIVQELKRHGIQVIMSKPEELSINTVNKYLELKARGLI